MLQFHFVVATIIFCGYDIPTCSAHFTFTIYLLGVFMPTSDVEILACKLRAAIPLKLNRNDDLSFSSKALAEGKEFWAKLKKSALSSEFVFELQKDNFSVRRLGNNASSSYNC